MNRIIKILLFPFWHCNPYLLLGKENEGQRYLKAADCFQRFLIHKTTSYEIFSAEYSDYCLHLQMFHASERNHQEVVGSIPTTGKNNKEYLL